MSLPMTRTQAHDEDLVLMVLLSLHETGHLLGPGSVPDLADMASAKAIDRLRDVGLIRGGDDALISSANWSPGKALGLTDDGVAEARKVAARLAEVKP